MAASKSKVGATGKGAGDVARLEAGDLVPDGEFENQDGEVVTIQSLRGKALVLYFYPKDDTPGCTKEACAFQENLGALKRKKVQVVGISSDPAARHRKFADKYGLTFPLLVDPDKTYAARCGVLGEKTLYGKTTIGVIRTTFIVDSKGVVRRVFRNVKVDGHVDEVVRALEELD